VRFVQGSLQDRTAVKDALDRVEIVYHQAALASVPRSVVAPLDTHDACVTGTLNLLDLSRTAGVKRVIYAGSSSAYGDQPFQSKREIDVPRPLSPYAAAKLAGEYYMQAFTATYGLETVAIRYFNVFGPRQDPNGEYSAVIPKFVVAILHGERPTIFGDGTQSRDFTYIDNVIAGNLAAATAPKAVGQVINVACGEQFSLLQLIDSINRVLGTEVDPIFAERRPGDIKSSLADISLAQELLGYKPVVNFEEGLRRSIKYYQSLTE
jgi:UDP-glucose 4-epimerase